MTRQRERKTCSRCGRRIVVKLTDGLLCNHKDGAGNWCSATATDDAPAEPARTRSWEERRIAESIGHFERRAGRGATAHEAQELAFWAPKYARAEHAAIELLRQVRARRRKGGAR